MMRVCPKRDALCPHGMDCPYVGEYDCTEPVRALSAVGQNAGTVEDRNVENSGYYYQHTPISVASAALIPAPSVAEAACEQCGRHVMEHPQPASGFLASCGKRLTRLDECGKAQCPTPSPVVPSGLEANNALTADRASCQARVEELERGMRRLMLAYVNLMETVRDRIISLGGTCDPVDVMEASDPWLRAARSALEGK